MSGTVVQDYNEELGRLHYEKGEYTKALTYFDKVSESFLSRKEYGRYVEAIYFVLRILVEREDFKRVQKQKESLQDIVLKENLQLNSRTHYILGLCSYYREGQEATAMDYFRKALKLAMEADNKSDMCFAIYGIANTLYAEKKYDEALAELNHLDVFFGALQIPDLQTSVKVTYGFIYRSKGDYEKALEYFWLAYEQLKEQYSVLLYHSVLYGLGSTYLKSGNTLLAKLYLQLANKSINPKELPRMARLLKDTLREIGSEGVEGEYDLIIDHATNAVVEKKIGKIDFKNQFILLELLGLFVRNPGRVYNKESLVRKVWNQEYDPTIHDNKVYVTIKRLRQMIEPEINKPQYIFRAKGGYFLSKSARIFVSQ